VGGSDGGNRAGKHPTIEQTRPESAKKPPPAPLTAAHNPKVVGSNPAPATIKPLILRKSAVFLAKKFRQIFCDAYPMLIFQFSFFR